MLSSNSDNHIAFNLEAVGGATVSTVRVLLHLDHTIMYTAEHVSDTKWTVNMRLGNVPSGSYSFNVEVLVGNRLFVPLSDKIRVQNVDVSVELDDEPAAAPVQISNFGDLPEQPQVQPTARWAAPSMPSTDLPAELMSLIPPELLTIEHDVPVRPVPPPSRITPESVKPPRPPSPQVSEPTTLARFRLLTGLSDPPKR